MDRAKTDRERLRAVIAGRVQGVNFRYYTTRTARSLGLAGWIANRRDGTVETVAEGHPAELSQFLAFLQKGPPAASVSTVTCTWEAATGEFEDFQVRYL